MASKYAMQVVERGSLRVVASWPPGLTDEHDAISEILRRVQAKGVGIFRTEARVLQALREVLEDAVEQVKAQVRP